MRILARAHAGAARSTTASSPRRQAWTRPTSASRRRRGAIPGRSRSRGSTTVARQTASCALDVEGAPARETEVFHGEKAVGRVTSSVPGLALAYVRNGSARRGADG